MCGKKDSCSGDDTIVDNSKPQEVKCCSETSIPGWKKKSGCIVWAQSALGDFRFCHKEKDFATAESICVANNGRLCTKEELNNNCAAGTGCNFNTEFIWSSTPGELVPTSYYFAVCGKFGYCTVEQEGEYAVDAEHEVRCCAESEIDGTFIKRSGCNVWASSKIVSGQCLHKVSHSVATSACNGIGARLCTVDELNGNCSSGSGCSFDRAIIWTSTVPDSQ